MKTYLTMDDILSGKINEMGSAKNVLEVLLELEPVLEAIHFNVMLHDYTDEFSSRYWELKVEISPAFLAEDNKEKTSFQTHFFDVYRCARTILRASFGEQPSKIYQLELKLLDDLRIVNSTLNSENSRYSDYLEYGPYEVGNDNGSEPLELLRMHLSDARSACSTLINRLLLDENKRLETGKPLQWFESKVKSGDPGEVGKN